MHRLYIWFHSLGRWVLAICGRSTGYILTKPYEFHAEEEKSSKLSRFLINIAWKSLFSIFRRENRTVDHFFTRKLLFRRRIFSSNYFQYLLHIANLWSNKEISKWSLLSNIFSEALTIFLCTYFKTHKFTGSKNLFQYFLKNIFPLLIAALFPFHSRYVVLQFLNYQFCKFVVHWHGKNWWVISIILIVKFLIRDESTDYLMGFLHF